VISAAENSNKFQKTKFWKETSVEDVVTLGPTAQATLVLFVMCDTLIHSIYLLIRRELFKSDPQR
jgi:hypothetical protein